VDDERLVARARGADVIAEARTLPFEIPRQPIVVEPGFADRHDLGLPSERDQLIDRWLAGILGVGVHADGGVEILVLAGKTQHVGKRSKIDADRERVRNAVRGHRVEHRRQLPCQLGKIQMTMGIDEHGTLKVVCRVNRRATPCSTRQVSASRRV
jgi:hypothetical protein